MSVQIKECICKGIFVPIQIFRSLVLALISIMLLSFNHVIEVAVPDVTTQFRVTEVPIVGL
jgi:hypothetical protein